MRIGLILNVLDEDYQIAIFRGIKERAFELGIEMFCIQQENHHFLEKILVSDFPKEQFFNLDGIIYLTSVMTDIYEVHSKKDLQKMFENIPAISVGQKISGVPSLVTQTDFSMKQLVEHLVLHHNYRKFVFFSGPQNHPDAISREEIFVKTMEAYMPWYSDLSYKVCHGLFTEAAAINLMSEIYKNNENEKIDCVVCSNDNMAIGVYKFFKMNRHKKSFKECAVTGFDDIPQLRYNIPSITTVHQPLEEIGKMAVDNLLKIINKQKVQPLTYVESRLIYRESCGCKPKIPEDRNVAFLDDVQSEFIKSEQTLRLVSRFGQDANNSLSFDVLRYFVKTNIEQMDIDNFAILLFDKDYTSESNEPLKIKPFYIFKRGQNVNYLYDENYDSFGAFLNKYTAGKEKKSYVFKYLISGNECLGCALYSCEDSLNPYLCTLIVTISQAMTRIFQDEEKQKHSKYLEAEVEKRTHELIEANNKRMEVEAEVLKISEMERQRFSNDLHDDICQRLAGISMLCRSYSNQNIPVEKEQMIELAQLITDTLQTTRQYAHNSFPVELETLGLNDSINNLCVTFEKQTGLKCDYNWNVQKSVEFETTQKLNIFRIVQEALHNIMKHAKAKSVEVNIIQENKNISISICDDGCGMPESGKSFNPGLGVNSMQYRANQIGATFNIVPNTPKGTKVQVNLQLP